MMEVDELREMLDEYKEKMKGFDLRELEFVRDNFVSILEELIAFKVELNELKAQLGSIESLRELHKDRLCSINSGVVRSCSAQSL